jgi:hypothetical protein
MKNNTRWWDMPEGKEKYSAYLCSREWSVLKEAVKSRSKGWCERCTINPMDHVHHLTYERKYEERLEDLQACCKQCHEFIHAKSDADPALDRPIVLPWRGESVKSFYLAGKITGTTWRETIVPDWSEENHSASYRNAHDWLSSLTSFEESVPANAWVVVRNVCNVHGANLHYTGPWWKDPLCHGSASDSMHPHGYSSCIERDFELSEIESRRVQVSDAVQVAIQRADLVFAWIDGPDCYGTILEIGYARAMDKAVVVAFSEEFASTKAAHEMWLLTKWGYYIEDESPQKAWNQFWKLVALEQEAKDGAAVG